MFEDSRSDKNEIWKIHIVRTKNAQCHLTNVTQQNFKVRLSNVY